MTRFASVVLSCVLTAAASSSASADTFFNFSFAGSSFSGSGVFDTQAQGSGSYLVNGVMGSVDTGNGTLRPIDAVLKTGTFEQNDNLLLFPAQSGAFFDGKGVSFSLLNGAEINLYSGNGSYLLRSNGDLVSQPATISVTPAAASAVPEPGSLGLLGTGVLAMAGLLKRRLTA